MRNPGGKNEYLVLNGNPRADGNTAAMVKAFAEGANEWLEPVDEAEHMGALC